MKKIIAIMLIAIFSFSSSFAEEKNKKMNLLSINDYKILK